MWLVLLDSIAKVSPWMWLVLLDSLAKVSPRKWLVLRDSKMRSNVWLCPSCKVMFCSFTG